MIALDRTTIAALRAHRSRQLAEADAYGDGYCDSGYVFTNRNGTPIAPGTLTHAFQKLLAEHGMPPIRLHDLRHGAAEKTAAYLLQAAGVVPGTTTRRRRTPARRGGLVASRTRAGLVRRRAPSERPEPARPRTRARPADRVRPRPAAVAA